MRGRPSACRISRRRVSCPVDMQVTACLLSRTWMTRTPCSRRWPTRPGGPCSTPCRAGRPDAVRAVHPHGEHPRPDVEPTGDLAAPRRPRGGRARPPAARGPLHLPRPRHRARCAPLRERWRRPPREDRTMRITRDERARRRPGQGAGLLHRRARVREEDRHPRSASTGGSPSSAPTTPRASSSCSSPTSTRPRSRSRRPSSPTASRSSLLRRRRRGRARAAHRGRRRVHPAADADRARSSPRSSTTPAATSSRSSPSGTGVTSLTPGPLPH